MTVCFKKRLYLFLFASLLLLSSCRNDPRTPNDTTVPEPTGWFASSNLSKGVFFTMAADPSNQSVIYAGSSAIGVHRTDDGGAAWKNANRGLPPQPTRSLFVDPNNTKNLYAGTAGGGLFFTDDSGENWRPFNNGLTNLDVYAVAYNPHAAPTGLQVTSGNTANVLHWNAVPNAASYEIYFCSATCETTSPPDSNWSPISRASADILKRDHTHTGLSNGTAYSYVVRAVVAGVPSPFSSRVSAVPKITSLETNPPNVPYPSGVAVTAGNNLAILRWNAIPGPAATYTIYKSGTPIDPNNLPLPPLVSDTLSITYTDTAAANGTVAYYAVIATQDVVTPDDPATTTIDEHTVVPTESALSAQVSAVPHAMTALFAATGGGGVFASGPAGEFRSTVNGTAPDFDLETSDERDISSLIIDPATLTNDLPTLYAGTRGGVYKTVDGGKSWSQIGGSLPPVLSLARSGSTLYAGTAAGIYQGVIDGSSLWMFAGNANQAITSITVDSIDPLTLYATSATGGISKSINGGISWDPANQGLTTLDIRSLSIHPLNSNLLYAGGVGTVFKSANGGIQWTPIDLGTLDNVANPFPSATVQTFAATSGAGSLLYAGGSAGVFKSVDQGKGWAAMNAQLGAGTVIALEIHPVRPAVLYAAVADQGIYKSLDGGGSWRLENGTSLDVPQRVTALIIDPNEPDRFYAGTSGLGVFRGTENADGHLSWTQVNIGLGSLGILTLAAAPGSPTTVYAGTFQSGIFKSTDDGSSWQNVGGVLSDKRILTLAVHPARPATVFAALSTGLYRSDDAGLTWTPVAGLQGIDVLTVSFDSATNPAAPLIYVGTSSGVFKSSDDGVNWTYMNDGMIAWVPSILADPQQQTTVYAGTLATGVFKRTR